ncbi:MAG: glycerol-3-phosphate 1-O-acyltransferase PlsY [Rickettsiales bacterium]|jgi:glycerol-3-phosphate acyltransferase PlsY|nr:glycerol-3-phosphate 1-O-acyltransferase PlsY [Rickettsiales bacterium]
MTYIFLALIVYLISAIPFGWVWTKLFTGKNLRESGSGNIGTANTMRVSKPLGVLTLICDAAKAWISYAAVVAIMPYLPQIAMPDHAVRICVVGIAVIAHCFPVYLKFHGGKGIATIFGGFLLISPIVAIFGLGVYLAVALATRMSALGSVCAVVFGSIFAVFYTHSAAAGWLAVMLMGLITWLHRGNLQRIANGTENKLPRKSILLIAAGTIAIAAAAVLIIL